MQQEAEGCLRPSLSSHFSTKRRRREFVFRGIQGILEVRPMLYISIQCNSTPCHFDADH